MMANLPLRAVATKIPQVLKRGMRDSVEKGRASKSETSCLIEYSVWLNEDGV